MVNFPSSLDTFTNPSSGDSLASPVAHHVYHTNHNDSIMALENKLGIDIATPIANSVFVGTGVGHSSYTTTPTISSINVLDSIIFTEETAPSVSSVGKAKIYASSVTHSIKSSVNGGAYNTLLTSGSVIATDLAASPSNSKFLRGDMTWAATSVSLLRPIAETGNPGETPLLFLPGTLVSTTEPGAVEYNGNNISVTNNAMRLILGGTIGGNYVAHHNTDTDETDLYSDRTPANLFFQPVDTVLAEWSGTFSSVSLATARLRVYFANNLLFDTGNLTILADSSWIIYASFMRTGTFQIRASIFMLTGGINTQVPPVVTSLNGMDFSTFNDIRISAQAGGGSGASNQIFGLSDLIVFQPSPFV